MKKSIKIFVIIVISILISGICVTVLGLESGTDGPQFDSKASLHYREFKNGLSEPAEGEKYFIDMIETPSYLCAWHGGIFFCKKDIVIDMYMNVCGVDRHEVYHPEIDANQTQRDRFKDNEEFAVIKYSICRPRYEWENVNLTVSRLKKMEEAKFDLISESYSGDSYIPTSTESYSFVIGDDGKAETIEATVTTSGYTRFIPQELHYDRNNAMSFLLADCDDNIGRPSASYVNVAFWAHLNDTPTSNTNPYGGSNPNPNPLSTIGNANTSSNMNISTVGAGLSASDMSKANSVTSTTIYDLQAYLEALENGYKLTDEQCKQIAEVAGLQLNPAEVAEIKKLIDEYKENRNSRDLIEKLKKELELLIEAVEASSDEKLDENKQNVVDYDQMWKDIGDNYSDTVHDKTVQEDVIVEYNATTQEYLIGPFTIEYVERYTSGYILAGMAGDPVLTVREDDNEVPIKRSSGEWKFTYLNPRVAGIPREQDYGYDEYPHNNEPFYITLKYKDGRNAILGLEVYFRYMQSESLWTRSIGEIEKLKWSAKFSLDTCIDGKCDGGGFEKLEQCHLERETGGYTHYHYSDTGDYGHEPSKRFYNKKDLDGCNKYSTTYKNCTEKSEDCNDAECKHKHDGEAGCKECGDWYYECQGHTCKKGTACDHGFYAMHYSNIRTFIRGKFIDTIPIQYIATCHWAWRLYFDVTKKFTWDIDITTCLEGDVWLDIDAQKEEVLSDVIDGDKEGNEHGVQDVLVTVKLYQDGSEVGEAIAHEDSGIRIKWPRRTDKFGHYHVDRIEAPGIDGGSDCYYVVEFAYDGQVYESTVFLQNSDGDDTAQQYMDAKGQGYFNKSMAVERSPERRSFDDSFSEIYGKSEMQGDLTTTGSSPGGDIQYKKSEDKIKKVSEDISKDSDNDLRRSEFISAATEDHENMQDDWEHTYDRYRITAYTHYAGDIGSGASAEDYQIYYPIDDEGKAYGSGNIRYIMNATVDGNKRYIDEYMLHINLGLKKRKETDISLLKDLYKMTVVVNEQEIVQNFNCLGPSDEDETTIKIKFNDQYKTLKDLVEKRRTEISANKLGLFSTDVAYDSSSRYKNAIGEVQKLKDKTELRVFATYAIRVYNNSDTNDVTINKLTDYYDNTYTLVDTKPMEGMLDDGIHVSIVKEDMERTNKLVADKPYYRVLSTSDDYDDISWKPTKEENLKGIKRTGDLTWNSGTPSTVGSMNKSITTSLKDIKLKVNEYVEIFTTYEIDYDGFIRMAGLTEEPVLDMSEKLQIRDKLHTGSKNNIAEVSNYSTFYSERDVEIDGTPINFYKAYEEGQNSGKIDKDSAPDNIRTGDILNMEYYEDDTHRAIPLNIQIESAERDLYGYVFEDKKTENGPYELKVGDGKYDEKDGSNALIQNVKVSMFEVISLGELDCLENDDIEYNDLDYYYEVPPEFYNINSTESEVLTTSTKATDRKGNEVDGNYYIYGYLPGDYILRFDYGTRKDDTSKIYEVDEKGKEIEKTVDIVKYNGQDYENTSFLSETKYTTDGETYTAINDKYLNLRQKDMKTADNKDGIKAVIEKDGCDAYSVARDNEARRMVVNAFSRTIENDRGEILRDREANNSLFVQATTMFAETPIMQIEINEPKELNDDTNLNDISAIDLVKTIDNKVDKDNRNKSNLFEHQYHIKNINFGLEERAKTDIKLEQYIESIYLMKDDDVIFSATLDEDGNVITDHKDNRHLDKLTYLSHYEIEKNPSSPQQGFYAISVEDDYLNGLSMKIDYNIKIINDSEVDFTGLLAYYYVAKDMIEAASYPPTTEAYTTKIKKWLEEEDNKETPLKIEKYTGLATNSTLKEMLKLFGRDPEGGILSELLSKNESNINSKIGDNDTLRPDIIVYGKYVGRYYYENIVDENEAKYYIKQYKWADREDVEITYQSDKVVETTVDQLIGYIDTNASYDLTTQNFENCAWDLSGNTEVTGNRVTIPTLDAIVSESSFRKIFDSADGSVIGESNIYDYKANALVTDVSSNIVIAKNNKMTKFGENSTLSGKTNTDRADTYLTNSSMVNNNWVKYRDDYTSVISKDNTALIKGLQSEKYTSDKNKFKAEMWIMTAKTTASDTDANNMKFDNLVEVLVYSNPTGRRDVYSVPGNAMALATKGDATTESSLPRPQEIGFWKAGYNSKKWWKNNTVGLSLTTPDEEFKELAAKKWTSLPEDDAYAPEFVTIIAPTGITLREYIRNVIIPITTLVIILIIMVGTFGVKQVKIHKKRDEF